MSDTSDLSFLDSGQLLHHHSAEHCDVPCPFHQPSAHHMVTWPLNWRGDLGLLERICPDGIGHPDPDSLAYLETNGEQGLGIHGCDGCCRRPVE